MDSHQSTATVKLDLSKPFDDLVHEELIALTEEQIQFYIDRECAEAGVPLLPPTAPEQPEIEQVAKTVRHFVIAGLRFSDGDEAAAVCKAIQAAKTRRTTQHLQSYRWSDPTYDAPDTSEIAVTVDYVFDADGAHRQKAATDSKAEKKAAYDEAKKTYDAAASGRENVGQRIRASVSNASRIERRRQELQREYDRYLPLANGDATVAKRFLQRAHSDARDVLPGLFPDVWNDEPTRPVAEPIDEVAF